jgi:H+-transporting ATPase
MIKENIASLREHGDAAQDFHKMTVEETVILLKTNLSLGLTQDEVNRRLKNYGYNEVPEKKPHPIISFAKKFWGLTAWMLEAIIILAIFLGKYTDLYTVGALLLLNSIIGFVQEQKASKAVELLKRRLQVNARILREGIWTTIPSREIVPGDVVRVRAGDFVPADIKIASGEVWVDQSALTGESMEVERKVGDLLYSGSIISRGEATGIIVLTGVKTFFGRTVQLVQVARPKLHMEEVISKVLKWLLIIVAVLLCVAIAFSAIRGISLLEILPLMLVLLLGAVPVALPAMFTVSMAIGSMELSNKGVLVTRLSASEDAASMDILCVDKTGTITMNRLSIADVAAVGRYYEDDVILYGALASQEANQDPIDLAFLDSARRRKISLDKFVQKTFIPFDPQRRRTEALISDGNGCSEFMVAKGALSVIAGLCNLDGEKLTEINERVKEFTKKGYRTIAVAKSAEGGHLDLVGLAALYDPPRPDAKELIERLRNLGVAVKMMTGDALPIAKEVAREVGLGERVIKASELKDLVRDNPKRAGEIAENSGGFAEVYPEDKYVIVKSLQERGHIVGMTGDGVNDAPALRQAEVGIAVVNATDVAKGSASVVLTSEGLTSILNLVKIGRLIFERINTWILNKITRTILKTVFVVLTFLMIGRYPISSSAMLLMMFMTDFMKISLSTDNVRGSDKPCRWNIMGLVKVSIVLGLLMVIEALSLFFLGIKYFNIIYDEQTLNMFSFQTLLLFAIFSILVARERGHFWHSKPGKTLLAAIIGDLVIAILIAFLGLPGLKPLPPTLILITLGYSIAFSLIINDFIKCILVRKALLEFEF